MTRRETSSLLQWSDSNQSTCYIKIVQTNNKYKSMQVLQQCDTKSKRDREWKIYNIAKYTKSSY